MTCWPHIGCPGAGPLDEHDIDAACARKATLLRECSVCRGACPVPAACEVAERAHRRQRGVIVVLAVMLGTVICAVCLAKYLGVQW